MREPSGGSGSCSHTHARQPGPLWHADPRDSDSTPVVENYWVCRVVVVVDEATGGAIVEDD